MLTKPCPRAGRIGCLGTMQPYIPTRLLAELTREQVALGLALIARAVRLGYKQGLGAKGARQSYARRKQGKAA